MAIATVTVDGKSVVALPRSWSNNPRQDYLQVAAFNSFTRVIGAAVAATMSGDWGLNDAMRPRERQLSLWNANYERWRSGVYFVNTKLWNGARYGRRPGTVEVAVPYTSDHGPGIAVDITGTAIQNWLHRYGGAYGWVFDVRGEPWHMAYKLRDLHAHEPVIDWEWVQRVVGASPDGKPGPGTITAVKKWQSARGLAADGLVGPATAKAMIASTQSDSGTAPAGPVSNPKSEGDFLMALPDDRQLQVAAAADRTLGTIQDLWVAPDPSNPKALKYVPRGTAGARPARLVTEADTNYLVLLVEQQEKALAVQGELIAAIHKKLGI